MYYHHLKKVWVLDVIDLFVLSFAISSFIGSKVRKVLNDREQEAEKRLRDNIIKESRLLTPSVETKNPDMQATLIESKIQKIYKLALQSRGGADRFEELENAKDLMADFFKRVTIKVVAFLHTNEARLQDKKQFRDLVLRIIVSQSRFAIEMLLRYCGINLSYVWLPEWDEYIVLAALASGSSFGFTAGWLRFGLLAYGSPALLFGLMLRSFYQQWHHNMEYEKIKEFGKRLLSDPEFKEAVSGFFAKANENSSSTKFSYEDLNWNKNPDIKKNAEKLGIFDNDPALNEPIGTLDSDADPLFSRPKRQAKSNFKPRRRGKTVYYRDFIENLDQKNKINELDVIDAEILDKKVKLSIKDRND